MKKIYQKIVRTKEMIELLSYVATIIGIGFVAYQVYLLKEIEQNRIALEGLKLLTSQDYAKAIGHVLGETKKLAKEKNEKLERDDIAESQLTAQYNLVLRIYYTLAFLYESDEANRCLLKKGSYEAVEQLVNLLKTQFDEEFQQIFVQDIDRVYNKMKQDCL